MISDRRAYSILETIVFSMSFILGIVMLLISINLIRTHASSSSRFFFLISGWILAMVGAIEILEKRKQSAGK